MNGRERWSAADPFFEFSLLGLLASGYLAVVGSGYLDAPTGLLTALGLVARALLVTGWLRFELSPRMVNVLTLAYVAFYPLDYLYISRDFLTATVHLVFFLAIVKVLTARTDRDYFYVKVIAFLELLAASILSSSANYFGFLALFLFFGVATLTASEMRRAAGRATHIVRVGSQRLGWRLSGLTLFSVTCILLLTASLFFLLPRTARAAFQRFVPQRYHLPGFSNEVTLGQIGELQMRDTVVMHVRFLTGLTPPGGVKWRGAALTQFDGKRWFNAVNPGEMLRVESGILMLASVNDTLRSGWRVSYEVAMQETTADVLFLAGAPESINIFVPMLVRTQAGGFRLGFGPIDRLRYRVHALLEDAGDPRFDGQELPAPQQAAALALPPLDPRIAEMTARVTAGTADEWEMARRVESYLRRTYPYTTELPQQESPDPVADFLFERKKGHCEYFASAMAVMLRTAGIPSRVATGFQSGAYNPVSGWWLVRARDAHSWVEAWLPGRGWTTFDPTPPDPNPPKPSIFSRLQMYMDALQVFWQDWVLAYDIDRQFSVVANVEQSSRSLSLRWLERWVESAGEGFRGSVESGRRYALPLVLGIAALVMLAIGGPAAWRWWLGVLRVRRVQGGKASPSDATVLYQRMLLHLRRSGFEKPVWLTPREFVPVVPDEAAAALLRDFTAVYNDLRFGNRPEAAPRLVELLARLEKTRIPKPAKRKAVRR